jgi:hypothetical protein
MKGDFSRDTFDSKKHYSTVLMQQGRVQVDADWNEQQAIDQFRIETEALDVIGPCGAPKHAPGFKLTLQADNQLSIGPGRFYVDGILCQNEAEVLFSQQPDLPTPPDFAAALSDSYAAVLYLDVWQRHLTALDDPHMREVALGGPDTATRLKTVWQVKVLAVQPPDSREDESALSCDSQFPEWDALTAPSTGRLNARTVPPGSTDNPCLIPPTAGYQCLENQLYRAEIHHGSEFGTVTFKWSRENGSVVTAIRKISGDRITVQDIGPDEVLGFGTGQWVEILDDNLELNRIPGELVQIQSISADGQEITVAPTPTTLGSTDGIEPKYHPKLRRWDHVIGSGEVAAAGVPISNDWIELEGGIQVLFSSGTYKTGDYWMIPARTATGQIEWFLDDSNTPIPQLPLGIQHHYCRLAIARLIRETITLQDCRHIFPPLTEIEVGEGCCTAVVQPGDDIQTALDALPVAGGCVCLKTGIHTIAQPLRITRSNVTLQGESLGARVTRPDGISLLIVAAPTGEELSQVTIEQIHFEAAGAIEESKTLSDLALISLMESANVTVQRCHLSVASAQDSSATSTQAHVLPVAQAIGVLVLNATECQIWQNIIRQTSIGILGQGCTNLQVSQNQITAPTVEVREAILPFGLVGVLLNPGSTQGNTGEGFPLPGLVSSSSGITGRGLETIAGQDCQIIDNQIDQFWVGAIAGTPTQGCQIWKNQIHRLPLPQLPPKDTPSGVLLVGSERYLYGIISFANACVIAENSLSLDSEFYGGIRASGELTRIEGNLIQANSLVNSRRITQLPVAIILAPLQFPASILPNASVIRGNTLIGTLNGISVVGMEGVEIQQNQINVIPQNTSVSIAIALVSVQNTMLVENQITGAQTGIFLTGTAPNNGSGNRLLHNQIKDGTSGINASAEIALEVSHNTIENMAQVGFAGGGLLETTRLTHNRVTYCGYGVADSGTGSGIIVATSTTDLRIESCEVLNIGLARDSQQISSGLAWSVGAIAVPFCRIERNTVGYTDFAKLKQLNPTKEHRALGLLPVTAPATPDQKVQPIGAATILDNVFAGLGLSALVQVVGSHPTDNVEIGFEKVTFSNNTSEHLGEQITTANTPSTVFLAGKHLIVMGNHVKEQIRTRASFHFNYHRRAVFIGNLTTSSFTQSSAVSPDSFVPPPPTTSSFNAVV